ncbi:MAG: sensor histidine kinase [Candidatus Dormibacteraeota bacterium]|nr:sensor histidine kinase [Candidatus Dormibacteraeota bacterium]
MAALLPVRRARGLRAVAWTVAAITVTSAGLSVLLFLLDANSLPGAPGQPWIVTAVAQVGAPAWAAAALGVVGALIVQRAPRQRFAWALLITTMTIGLVLLAQEYAEIGLVVAPGSVPGAQVAAWFQTVAYYLMPLQVFVCMLLFPTGALFSRLLIPVIVAAAAVTVLFMLTQLDLTQPLQTTIRPGVLLPASMPPQLWGVGAMFTPAFWPAFWAIVALPLLGAVLLCVRLVRSRSVERVQLRWIAATGVVAAIGWPAIFAPSVLGQTTVPEAIAAWGSVLWIIGICVGTPITVAIAILRYNVYDIDRVLARTLLYGGLSLFIAVLYIVVVFGIGSHFGGETEPVLSLIVTVIVAIVLAPLRDRLQTLANRIVYGPRATLLEVLSQVSQAMNLTPAIDDSLPQIAALVGNATSSASVEVWLRDEDDLRLESHWPDGAFDTEQRIPLSGDDLRPLFKGRTRVLPVRVEDEFLGCIAVTQPPTRRLSPAEENLLSAIASHAGLLLRNVRLVEDLRASRQRVLTTGAEQRRRLERDLHDGAQQHLVTASLALGLARAQLMRGDLAVVESSLNEATQQLKEGLGELRVLARGLYPAVLSRAGLAAALGTLAERTPIPVELDVNLTGRRAPVVESNAYFVVSEALTNVAKHADAGRAVVRAQEVDGWLFLDIEDDGRGGAMPSTGSGLRGLQDRVHTLGGSLSIESPPGQGTRIHVEIPAGDPVPENAAVMQEAL